MLPPLIFKLFVLGSIKCYYCKHLEGDCNENMAGEIVECQMSNPRENYYGDACFVGYSGIVELRFCNVCKTSFCFLLCSSLETGLKVNYLIQFSAMVRLIIGGEVVGFTLMKCWDAESILLPRTEKNIQLRNVFVKQMNVIKKCSQ